MKKYWCLSPHSGGNKIPPTFHQAILKQVEAYAATRPWHTKFQLKIRFKSHFCYLDALEIGGDLSPIGRLRYFDIDRWSLSFYTFSNETYQPCAFANGDFFGTIEQAISDCVRVVIP